MFAVELQGETLVITPRTGNLRELSFQQIETEGSEVVAALERSPARNVVVDLRQVDYCGSTALGFLLRLGRIVRSRGGSMALCNVSEHGKAILSVVNLEDAWPIHPTKEDALQAVAHGPREPRPTP
jgi:anti-anti-sigma factor